MTLQIEITMNTKIIQQLQTSLKNLKPKLENERRLRSEFNRAAQDFVKRRNRLNSQTKKSIHEANLLQEERNSHNQSVREYKKKRKQIADELRDIKKKTAQTADEQKLLGRKLIDLQKAHNRAHENVQQEATLAQEKHDLMIEKNAETQNLRNEANEEHKGLRQAKQKADQHHKRCIVLMTCQKSCKSILDAIQERDKSILESEEVIIEEGNLEQAPHIENNDDIFDNAGL
tara:strand:+ start:214 stop:906 length:693 start_codon:yes stop_codon:yes gene_type:complete